MGRASNKAWYFLRKIYKVSSLNVRTDYGKHTYGFE